MKVSKIPGKFELPDYGIPNELEVALREGLDNVNDSKKTPFLVNHLKQLIKKRAIPATDISSYMLLLSVEQHFENEEIKKHKLYNQSPVYDEKKKCFKITVPDLNEDDPFITGGDFVHLHDKIAKTEHVLFIVDIWNGSLNAEPVGPKKSVEWFSKDRTYDVTFSLSHYPLRCAKFAVIKMNEWNLTNEILNPTSKPQSYVKDRIYEWFNSKIDTNNEQKKAIHDIVNKTAYPAPYILFGPPGTGKTATIVEAISQIYLLGDTKKVLVCTPANSPADDITKMLIRNLPSNTILRLCSVSRESKLVDKELMKCSNVYYESGDEKKRRFMQREEIEDKRVIICTLTSSLKLLALRLGPSHFSHIFIDEAAQASEPETWIPISLLVANSRTSTQVVLSGDPMQLGPVIKSKFIEHLLGVSMMERLMSLDCYKNEIKKQSYMTKLIQNYRCHSSIVKVPNELFYDDELQCCGGSEILQAINWKYLPNKKFPIIFHAVFGEEEKSEKHPSPFNGKEIGVCLLYVKRLKEANKFKDENIGIITPFKRQEIFIKNRLKNQGNPKIDVGTVQTFQGLEKDVIIMSTVRTRLLKHNGKKHIGFLSNKQRFNVSITRAKSLLIVIGNPTILCHDQAWFEFIKFCKDNNACTGEKFVPEKPRTFISEVPARPAKKQLTKPSSPGIVFSPSRISDVIPERKSSLAYLLEPVDHFTWNVQTEYSVPPSCPTSAQKIVRPTPQSRSQISHIPSKYSVPSPVIYSSQNQIRSVPQISRGMADDAATRTGNQSSRFSFSKMFRTIRRCCSCVKKTIFGKS